MIKGRSETRWKLCGRKTCFMIANHAITVETDESRIITFIFLSFWNLACLATLWLFSFSRNSYGVSYTRCFFSWRQILINSIYSLPSFTPWHRQLIAISWIPRVASRYFVEKFSATDRICENTEIALSEKFNIRHISKLRLILGSQEKLINQIKSFALLYRVTLIPD